MAGQVLQFSLRRLLLLAFAWSVGAAIASCLHHGPWTFACAALYGLLGSALILGDRWRVLAIWIICFLLLCTITLLLIMMAAASRGLAVIQLVILPATAIYQEQRMGLGWEGFNQLFWLPILIVVYYTPCVTLIVTTIDLAVRVRAGTPAEP
jgi:hypothetical protein